MHLWQPYEIREPVGVLECPVFDPTRPSSLELYRALAAIYFIKERSHRMILSWIVLRSSGSMIDSFSMDNSRASSSFRSPRDSCDAGNCLTTVSMTLVTMTAPAFGGMFGGVYGGASW